MNNPESKEMYLETILRLKNKGARVRSTDVASELGYSRPSVSNAVKKLIAEGYIFVDKDGELVLTEKGNKQANSTYERHIVLTSLFKKMGAAETVAEEDACRIEHVISDELFEVLKNYDGSLK
ncbi:MAG: metal-dependent transcriptional regulator [Clostridia bacterium]|nr:metal-dependent transcriptional regulator [Clostridia bacterium]MBR1675761.1 metal-dependent transcriptional regulator [Clostridia bacterium]